MYIEEQEVNVSCLELKDVLEAISCKDVRGTCNWLMGSLNNNDGFPFIRFGKLLALLEDNDVEYIISEEDEDQYQNDNVMLY